MVFFFTVVCKGFLPNLDEFAVGVDLLFNSVYLVTDFLFNHLFGKFDDFYDGIFLLVVYLDLVIKCQIFILFHSQIADFIEPVKFSLFLAQHFNPVFSAVRPEFEGVHIIDEVVEDSHDVLSHLLLHINHGLFQLPPRLTGILVCFVHINQGVNHIFGLFTEIISGFLESLLSIFSGFKAATDFTNKVINMLGIFNKQFVVFRVVVDNEPLGFKFGDIFFH